MACTASGGLHPAPISRPSHHRAEGGRCVKSRCSMEQGLEMRPALWHANGKFVLFVHELHEVSCAMPCT